MWSRYVRLTSRSIWRMSGDQLWARLFISCHAHHHHHHHHYHHQHCHLILHHFHHSSATESTHSSTVLRGDCMPVQRDSFFNPAVNCPRLNLRSNLSQMCYEWPPYTRLNELSTRCYNPIQYNVSICLCISSFLLTAFLHPSSQQILYHWNWWRQDDDDDDDGDDTKLVYNET